MVQLMSSRKFSPDSESALAATPGRKMGPIKVEVEVEDSLEDQHGPLNKRSKFSSCYQQGDSGTGACALPPSQYNPLDEPSPLGLRLRKSPSLLDLIQMRLSQGNTDKLETQVKKDHKGSSAGTPDKLKASNFPGSVLRIGTWEYVSRYEGDLVAKCYFAKHKLVWEVLDGGLKNKIEIQWSDIVALKASYPDNGPGTLDIVLARHPLFFKETNPQPRKHTLWQATSDFTGGQASIHRHHFLQCSQGLLGKHFEKLIQCDPRLNFLSQQPEIVLESQYFESKVSDLEDQDESQRHGFDLNSDEGSSFYGMRGSVSPSGAQLSSMSESQDHTSMPAEHFSAETPSPSSVMDTHAIEDTGSHVTEEPKGLSHLDHFKVPGLHPSMSMSDLVTHIGHCLSGQITSSNPLLNEEQNKDILEEITQYLLSDTQLASTSDEPSLMSRVNSLCSLLQKEPGESNAITSLGFETKSKAAVSFNVSEAESKPPPSMPRIDSVGELLLNLPRIASLPKFLFNISEDDDNSSRP